MAEVCIVCGEEFERKHGAKYCPECRAEGRRICVSCGKEFVTTSKTRCLCKKCDALRAEKARRVKVCRTAPKKLPTNNVYRQCVVCERMFDAVGQEKTCPTCREYRQEKKEVCEKMAREPHNPQRLAEMAKAAREMGMSYGKYSAMKRGLLKV